MRSNPDLFPCSANIQVKLESPKELKEDKKKLENVQEWENYVNKMKNDLKERIVKQGKQTANLLQEKMLQAFNDHLLIITEGSAAWHSALKGVTEIPLSNHAYGAASLCVLLLQCTPLLP